MTRVLADFTARWTVCWTTTYTFEPPFFETVLARRLGEPPINLVVLADAAKLARIWAEITPAEQWSIRGANRTYLVRGVTLSGGVFHAKTIFLANDREGVLLVGSGNVGLRGLEHGHEVFSRFRSNHAASLPAFGAWRSWMAQIVSRLDDPLVRIRWADLLSRARWLPADSNGSAFVTNWRDPLVDALVGPIQPPADELLVSAPFFDADLRAMKAIIERASPRRIRLYLGEPTSVDGPRLAEVLTRSGAALEIHGIRPSAFVHAKLFALVQGGEARLLSGSANASGPALLRTAVDTDGNAEAGCIADMRAAEAEALFVPPGMSTVPLDLAAVSRLAFVRISEAPLPPVRLMSATFGQDRRLTVAADPLPAVAYLTDGRTQTQVRQGRSVEPVDEPSPSLVWLEDLDGSRLSNSVPLDHRYELDRVLAAREGGAEKPRDLDVLDLEHPLGRLLAALHRAALFDVDDTVAAHHAQQRTNEDAEADDEFWERLLREELATDPRAAGYSRRALGEPGFLDDLGWLLEEMLHRAPSPTVLRLVGGNELERSTAETEGRPWTVDQKLAVRAYNVLARWAIAIADPRVRWISELAPVRHYGALLGVIAEIWPKGWIRQDRLRSLLEILFGSFLRTERAVGYLESLDESSREAAIEALAESSAPQVAAALAFVALRDVGTDTYFEWQPFLVPGLSWGVFSPSDAAANLATTLCGNAVTAGALSGRLSSVSTYVDDSHWCLRVAAELGLGVVRIGVAKHPVYNVEVDAEGLTDLINDPRSVALTRAALVYRPGTGIRLRSQSDVLAIASGKLLFGRVGGRTVSSDISITDRLLEGLVAQGQSYSSLSLIDETLVS